VTVIATAPSSTAALAAKAATLSIPIVFLVGTDSVDAGQVTNLQRPDANITGVTNLSRELSANRLESSYEVVPSRTSIALVVNPDNANVKLEVGEVEKAPRVVDVPTQVMEATNRAQIERTFDRLAGLRLSRRRGHRVEPTIVDAACCIRSGQELVHLYGSAALEHGSRC
jgi:putative ABC transport system substrate-binding protein